MIQKRRGKSEI